MTLSKPIPTRGRAEQTQLRPRARFFVDFRRGVADALTGQTYVFSGGQVFVEATNGIGYLNGFGIPNLNYTPGGLGLTGVGGLTYELLNRQLRISQLPLVPLQVAWHGMLPSIGTGNTTIFSVGGPTGIQLQCDDTGVNGFYENSSSAVVTSKVQMTRQQECFVVVQLIPDGASNVRVRMAVKRRVAFDDPAWEIGTPSAAIACDLLLNDPELNFQGASPTGQDRITYRLLFQDGTNDVEDLPWDWNARRDGLPGAYGLMENGFIELVLDAGNELYFRDDPSYVSIDTDPPTDYLALAPGGISSPYIYLESLV